MNRNFIILSLIILSIKFCLGQNYYFEPDEILNYKFVYINSEYDTVAVGDIQIKPTNDEWQYDSNQKEVLFEYTFQKRDTSYFNIGEHGLPITNGLIESTGYLETDDSFWTHPFSANIFYITEIAPFPYFTKGNNIIKTKSTLYIGEGWGEFKGKSKRNYRISNFSHKNKESSGKQLKKVKMRAKHKLGKSYLEMIISDEDGIIEMKYKFFNKDMLKIIKIE